MLVKDKMNIPYSILAVPLIKKINTVQYIFTFNLFNQYDISLPRIIDHGIKSSGEIKFDSLLS